MTKEELISFWVESSEENYRSMLNMCRSGEFVWALFVGHLCLEKLLKALHVKNVANVAPRIHDLYRLALRCGLDMTDAQRDALQYVTQFNIEARYEEHQRVFRKKCTQEFAEKSVETISELRTWLLERIKN